MCGICGIASTRGAVDPGRLAAMSATLVQRGADSDGAVGEGGGRLAPRRLPLDPGRLPAMSATLVQRGPDSDGTFVEGAVGLAARRLAIIDLTTGDQPITNEAHGVTVVQNGEIYNYRELRLDLQRDRHRLWTSGDTEVLTHLYSIHGERFV